MLGPSPDGAAVRHCVEESHRLALAYLRQRARVGALEARRFGLSLDDLALDCIADLFQRDDAGRFVQLVDYFESSGWQDEDPAGLRIALRRLVFSKVNEGLFRRHRGHDPELARIIRNVKNAVKASEGMALMRRGKELWMVVGDPAGLGQKPPMAFETLEAHLTPVLREATHMPEVVASFQELVQTLAGCDAGYPVSRFAMAVRAAAARLAAAPEPDGNGRTPSSEMVERAIAQSIDEMREAMLETYVASGKMDAQLFEQYVHAARDVLGAQFCSTAPPVASYYDALSARISNLSKEDYRAHHRHVLEYLVKMSRTRLVACLREVV